MILYTRSKSLSAIFVLTFNVALSVFKLSSTTPLLEFIKMLVACFYFASHYRMNERVHLDMLIRIFEKIYKTLPKPEEDSESSPSGDTSYLYKQRINVR